MMHTHSEARWRSARRAVGREPFPRRPLTKALDVGTKLLASGREAVARAALMFGESRRAQIPQPLREHARGHVGYRRSKLAVGLRVPPKFPDDPQRPATAEQVEEFEQRSAVMWRVVARFARLARHVRHALLPTDNRPGSLPER